ncbi:MAG TPA: hypothetical protein P5314_00060 [Tetrasphaera sp.]|nr:hypothetical protein [Tetrasphaera sp.]
MTQIAIERVVTEAQFQEFADLPVRLHGHGRHVPLLQPVLHAWWTGHFPQAEHGPVGFFLARREGAAVGRICLHHNHLFDDKIGAEAQLFGLCEFADAEVLAALLGTVEREARAAARTCLVGPVALLPNQTGGVITSGFGERGFMDSPWNPDYYPTAYESLGCTRIFAGATWICENFDNLDPATTFRFDDARLAAEGLNVRRASRWRLGRDLESMRAVLNTAFAVLPYYTQISASDLAAQADGLEVLLDEALFLQLFKHDEPVAFVLAVPDISEFVMARGGRLGMRDQLALVATRRRYRTDAILIIKGTHPDAQGKGYLTLLSRELLRGLQAGDYRRLRSTFVEDANAGSAAQYERMGGRPLHETTFYRKEIR